MSFVIKYPISFKREKIFCFLATKNDLFLKTKRKEKIISKVESEANWSVIKPAGKKSNIETYEIEMISENIGECTSRKVKDFLLNSVEK